MNKQVNQTLQEQMKITDAEIRQRLELFHLEENDIVLLKEAADIIEENMSSIVNEFYDTQLKVDEISIIIGDLDTLMKLKNEQSNYIRLLFSGCYDSNYVNNRLRIGLVHKRIGVEPKLYLSAMSLLKSILHNTLEKHITDGENIIQTQHALAKLFYFDAALVFDTYISSMVAEIRVAKDKLKIYADSLEEKVAERTAELQNLASTDPLTKLLNQRSMRERAKTLIAKSRRLKEAVSVIYFDVDNFKAINDKEGHSKGDEVLSFIGEILSGSFREEDILCRCGGDEFCIISSSDNAFAAEKMKVIIKKFSEKFPDYSLSIGIFGSKFDMKLSIDEMLHEADQRMYQAKTIKGSHIQIE